MTSPKTPHEEFEAVVDRAIKLFQQYEQCDDYHIHNSTDRLIPDTHTKSDWEEHRYFDEDKLKLALYKAIDSMVIKSDDVFVDIPVLDGNGKIERIIGGNSFTPIMVARNQLRDEQRFILYGEKK